MARSEDLAKILRVEDGGTAKASIVIPVHNEAGNIRTLLLEIDQIFTPSEDLEVVVVDDHSTDNTLEILRELKGIFPFLRVICHRKRYGQSMALLSGIKMAQADLIITMDGDGQNDPNDIPRLVNTFEENRSDFLLVTGKRRKRKDTWLKRVSSKVANKIRSYILKDETPDTGCGLKVFRRSDFLSIPAFDHMHRFLPALFLAMGGRVISVEVAHRPRQKGMSHYGTLDRLWSGIWDLFGVFWLMRRIRPVDLEEINGHED